MKRFDVLSDVLRVAGIAVAAIACAAIFGVGVPLGWVWIASQVQPTGAQGVSAVSAIVLIVGTVVTFALLGMALGRVGGQKATRQTRQMSWHRSFSDSPKATRPASALEQVMVITTLVVAAGFEVWLMFFAHQTPWG